jgi:hypothetical protein
VVSVTAYLAQHSSVRGLDAEFLDLICADEELLRAEFDAIVAAGWPTEPRATRATGRRLGGLPAGGRGVASIGIQAQERDAPEVRARSRQRSPPSAGGR